MHVLNSCFKPIAVVTRKLEDVLDAKNGAIKNLQYELARVCKVKFFWNINSDSKCTYKNKYF